jgi:hypothetical protein
MPGIPTVADSIGLLERARASTQDAIDLATTAPLGENSEFQTAIGDALVPLSCVAMPNGTPRESVQQVRTATALLYNASTLGKTATSADDKAQVVKALQTASFDISGAKDMLTRFL